MTDMGTDSMDEMIARVSQAAGVDAEGDPRPGTRPADALLCVSGSHPARYGCPPEICRFTLRRELNTG